MRIALIVFASWIACSGVCVSQKTGPSVATGVCNIAISGNNNTVATATLRNCGGMDKEQGEKIIKLLNAILAKKDLAQINAKLDELIDAAVKPVMQTQNCVGSACAQGAGSQATYNQYGAPKLVMTDEQKSEITKAMMPFAGMEFNLFLQDATVDSTEYADKLRDALKDAGMICKSEGSIVSSGPMRPGISISVSKNDLQALTPAITTLAYTLRRVGLIGADARLPLSTPDGHFDPPLDIIVAPNR